LGVGEAPWLGIRGMKRDVAAGVAADVAGAEAGAGVAALGVGEARGEARGEAPWLGIRGMKGDDAPGGALPPADGVEAFFGAHAAFFGDDWRKLSARPVFGLLEARAVGGGDGGVASSSAPLGWRGGSRPSISPSHLGPFAGWYSNGLRLADHAEVSEG
jgi:hypothetical protein